MKQLNNWEDTLQYVNRIGVTPRSMPIGWKQQVLMKNVAAIESTVIMWQDGHAFFRDESIYPIKIRYCKTLDSFILKDAVAIKAIHR